MNDWIDVHESLPQEDGDYLVYLIDNGACYRIAVSRFYKEKTELRGIFHDDKTHWGITKWDDDVVTHWMALPKPPREEND